MIHKSDVGGVLLGLKSRPEVERAIATLSERMKSIGVELKRVLLQREIRGGIEALVGVTVDQAFGPMLVCGMGGVLVELIKDVAFCLPPVSDLDAAEMIGKLRAGRLLDGYRGAPAGDREALIRVLQKVSALVEIVPELQDLDLNPIKVLEPGKRGNRGGWTHENRRMKSPVSCTLFTCSWKFEAPIRRSGHHGFVPQETAGPVARRTRG